MSAAVAAKKWFKTIHEASQKKSLLHRVQAFEGLVKINYENADFAVTTATDGSQLLKALELRHEVFIEEWQGRRAYHRMDVDEYDFAADHLLIVDKRTQQVVGTYRLLSSHFTQNFYTCDEFNLKLFLRVPAVKLEMGRACIQARYRNGGTIDALWKGLGQNVEATKTEYLFGCSSIKTMDAAVISRLYRALQDQGSWTDEYMSRPTPAFVMPGFNAMGANTLNAAEKRDLIPPLLRSYLHAGAHVHGLPARDLSFGCTDVLTILDWKQLNKRFQSRFLNQS